MVRYLHENSKAFESAVVNDNLRKFFLYNRRFLAESAVTTSVAVVILHPNTQFQFIIPYIGTAVN